MFKLSSIQKILTYSNLLLQIIAFSINFIIFENKSYAIYLMNKLLCQFQMKYMQSVFERELYFNLSHLSLFHFHNGLWVVNQFFFPLSRSS